MHSIIVLTGSLGSGKTTVGKLMASRLSNGAHIESDVFYTFFSHPIAPDLPEADKQNKAAIAAACQAAKALYQRGYCVVLEGIFGPWALPLISAELATHTADVRYVILRTTLDEAIRRVRGRSGMSLDEVVATMHPQFEQLGEWEGNALETSCLAPTTVVDQLMDLLPNGLFRLSSSGVLHAGGVQPFHREDVTRQAGRRLSCQTLDLMTRAREPKRVSPFSILEARPFLASLNSAILGALQVRDLVEDMHKLNVHEQTVICVDTFLKESEADGVSHFFYYESAALYDKVLLGLEAIGAYGTRIGLSRYVDRVFAGEVPRSVSARQATIDSLDDAQADQAERMVGNVSDATSLLATWAKTHREHFRLE